MPAAATSLAAAAASLADRSARAMASAGKFGSVKVAVLCPCR
jgi:hypothetical protein